MNKKKIVKILVIILIVLVVIAVAQMCILLNNKKNEDNDTETFSIKYNNVEIVPGTEFKKDAIEEQHIFSEIPSCAFEGTDKVYTYDNLEIIVAEIKGKETVYSVYFLDDEQETAEGVKISDSKELMIEKYGEEYKQTLGNRYTYTKERVELSFIVESGTITSIEYTLKVDI